MTAATVRELERQLRAELPPACFEAIPSEFAVDDLEPSIVVAPASPEGVGACLRAASEADAAVIAWGGGSHMALGMPPARYDLALDLHRLDLVLEYEPADLTVTVQAGVKLQDLQQLLAKQGQWLPLDPAAGPRSTIGGILAVNASGPARVAYGTARDLVIGMKVVTAEGKAVKSGGRVVKNVAGYDMAKMHTGALGTLGVVVEVTLKVAPLPKASQTLSIESEDLDRLAELAFRVREAGLPASGTAISRVVGGSNRLALRFAGSESAVERSVERATGAASDLGLAAEQAPAGLWGELNAMRDPASGSIFRINHAPRAAVENVKHASALGADVLSYATAGVTFGRLIALGAPQQKAVRRLRASVEAEGGALVLEAAPVEAKRALGVWGSTAADFGLMRRLKEQMDAKGILGPERYVGGI